MTKGPFLFVLFACLAGIFSACGGGGSENAQPAAMPGGGGENAHPAAMPGGSYANGYSADVTANPAVEGVMVTMSWKAIETSEGIFDWTNVDSEINAILADGKDSITLNLAAGGEETPDWLLPLAGATYTFLDINSYHPTYCTSITIPVFWDSDIPELPTVR